MKRLWLILFVIIGCASTTQSFPKPNTAGLKTGNVRIKLSREVWEFEYYPNGQVKEEPSFKDGKKHGDWVRYFPNGDIMGIRTFKVGLKEGVWIEYYKNPPGNRNDIIAWQGKYVADKREGKWEWLWLNQEKQRVETYKEGILVSKKCFERDGSGSTRDCN
tara:strand:+ start:376 stop:858 length:483 start_codon:yes stop_codon:yes gene_type:complete